MGFGSVFYTYIYIYFHNTLNFSCIGPWSADMAVFGSICLLKFPFVFVSLQAMNLNAHKILLRLFVPGLFCALVGAINFAFWNACACPLHFVQFDVFRKLNVAHLQGSGEICIDSSVRVPRLCDNAVASHDPRQNTTRDCIWRAGRPERSEYGVIFRGCAERLRWEHRLKIGYLLL